MARRKVFFRELVDSMSRSPKGPYIGMIVSLLLFALPALCIKYFLIAPAFEALHERPVVASVGPVSVGPAMLKLAGTVIVGRMAMWGLIIFAVFIFVAAIVALIERKFSRRR